MSEQYLEGSFVGEHQDQTSFLRINEDGSSIEIEKLAGEEEAMTDADAEEILRRDGFEVDKPSLVDVLRARAQMWRGATSPMIRDHAVYIDKAADRIEELEAAGSIVVRAIRHGAAS